MEKRIPSREELQKALLARCTREEAEKLWNAKIAVAGLGGLGSNVSVFLTRAGVGHLHLIDFDKVDMTNLNRQHYFISHLGQYKTQALQEQIRQINPFIQVKTHTVRLTAQNAAEIFSGCQVICEALDRPQSKAELVAAVLEGLPQAKVVAASGMAGYGSANEIETRRKLSRLYLCGDLVSEAQPGQGLMAPRVSVCAGHQANMVLRLLLGMDEP